jgi:anti-sigma factor RsiW
MDCRQCTDDLTAYMDGELEGAVAEEMRIHLAKCPPCHEEYRDLRDSTALVVAHARELEPVPEIWNNLRNRIAEMPPPSSSFGFFQFLVVNRWAAAVTTLAATIVLTIGMWSYIQYQQSRSELESSLNGYVRIRAVAERLHSKQLTEAENAPLNMHYFGPKNMENPFAEIRPVSFTNPFRSEDR